MILTAIVHRAGDKLLQANPGQQVGERQILAERHEMQLVDGIDDLAGIANGQDRIVVALAAAGAGRGLFPDSPGHQHLSFVQHVGDGCQHLGPLGEQEGDRRFGP